MLFRSIVQDYLVYGHGWGKVGWKYSERPRLLSEEERTESVAEQNNVLDEFAEANPDMALDLPSAEDVATMHPTETMETLEDAPFFERVSPFDVFVDPEATSLADAQWIAQRIVMPLDRAKKDERFSRSARRKLRADGSLKWFNEENKQNIPEDRKSTR